MFIKNYQATVTVEPVDYSNFIPNGWSQNQNFPIQGEEVLQKSFTIENTHNNLRMDTVVRLEAESTDFSSDDSLGCKIWLYQDSTELAEAESTNSDDILITGSYNDINAGSSRTGSWKIQCGPDFNSTVSINLEMEATAEFSFQD